MKHHAHILLAAIAAAILHTSPFTLHASSVPVWADSDTGAIVSPESFVPLTAGAALPWADITGTPTTLSGYGITDAYTQSAADAAFATAVQGALADSALQAGDALPWADVTHTPTTLSGFGITDAATAIQGAYADTARDYPITRDRAGSYRLISRLDEIASGGDNLRVLHVGDSLGLNVGPALHKHFLSWYDSDAVTTWSLWPGGSTDGGLSVAGGGFIGDFVYHIKEDYALNWIGSYASLAESGIGIITADAGGSSAQTRACQVKRVQFYCVTEPGAGTIKIEYTEDVVAGEASVTDPSWTSPTDTQITSSHTLTGGELIVDLDDTFGLETVEITFDDIDSKRIFKITEQGAGDIKMISPMFFADSSHAAIESYKMAVNSNSWGSIETGASDIMAGLIAKLRPDLITFQADDLASMWSDNLESQITTSLAGADLDYTPTILLIGEGPKLNDFSAENVRNQARVTSEMAARNLWTSFSCLSIAGSWAEYYNIFDPTLSGDGTHLADDFYQAAADHLASLWGIDEGPYVSVGDYNVGSATINARLERAAWEADVSTNGGVLSDVSADIAEGILLELHRRGLRDHVKYLLPLLGDDLNAAIVPLINDYAVAIPTVEGYVDADFSETSGLQRAPSGNHWLDLHLGYADGAIAGDDDLWHVAFHGLTVGAPFNIRSSAQDTVGWAPIGANTESLNPLMTNNVTRWISSDIYNDGFWSFGREHTLGVAYHNGELYFNVINNHAPAMLGGATPLLLGVYRANAASYYTPTDATITVFAKTDFMTAQQVQVFYEILRDCLMIPLGREY